LAKRLDEYVLQMIACGVEPELDAIVTEQRAREAIWRRETLAEWRAKLRVAATEEW
jgi:hypothetical protein